MAKAEGHTVLLLRTLGRNYYCSADEFLKKIQRQLKEQVDCFNRLKDSGSYAIEKYSKCLDDERLLMDVLQSGELEAAAHDVNAHAVIEGELYDQFHCNILNACLEYGIAMENKADENILRVALAQACGFISSAQVYCDWLKDPQLTGGKLRQGSTADNADAGALGGQQRGENFLLIRTKVELLLYQMRPSNGWKDATAAAKGIAKPLLEFIEKNNLSTLGNLGESVSEKTNNLIGRIQEWMAKDAAIRKSFEVLSGGTPTT